MVYQTNRDLFVIIPNLKKKQKTCFPRYTQLPLSCLIATSLLQSRVSLSHRVSTLSKSFRTNKIKKLKSHEFELGFNFHLIYNAALYDLSITSNPRSASTGSQHLQRRFLIVHLQLGIEAPARQPEAPSVSVRVNADCSEQRAGTAEAMEGFCGVSARGDFGVCVERGVV